MSKRVSKAEYAQQKKAEQKALEAKLTSFLHTAMTSEGGLADLTAHYKISGLYKYSFYNSILIHMQGGTICQSFKNWKKLDRQVNKREKSRISVFAPMLIDEKDDAGNKTGEKICIGFRMVPTFDISQTSGEELKYDHNSVDTVKDYEGIKTKMEELAGTKVIEEFTGTARGWSNGAQVAVSSMSNDTDKTKTLIHEIAHHLMHTGPKADKKNKLSYSACEIEAESVTHLVNEYLGIEYELTASYVAGYKKGMDEIRVKKIVSTADKIIKALQS
jgi:hypothetical protein